MRPSGRRVFNVSEVVPAVSLWIRPFLLVQMLHGGGAQDNEKTHPERGPLKGNHFVGFAFFGVIVGFENDRIQEQSQQAQHEAPVFKF